MWCKDRYYCAGMAEETLTIQVHAGGCWEDAAELAIRDVDAGRTSATRLSYLDDYLTGHIDSLGARNERAVGERFPLNFEVWSNPTWPAFLLDIMPSGAARRWWRRRLADDDLNERQLDYVLLRDHTIAPVGHLRVATPAASESEPIPFSKDEVCRRDVGFLEHAAESGAAIGGATGAGGDAPKVLLAEDADGNVYPAGALPDGDTAACWLVKWPRGRDTDRDRLVLRTEYLYSRVLSQLGFDICAGEWRRVDEGKPSLWLPRFDRVVAPEGLRRLAVESFYSLAGISEPGATVSHETFIDTVANALERRGRSGEIGDFVREYVCRDLLDVVLGNTDNHGRNRAVLRTGKFRLAPMFDLAPMAMDPEGITRSTRWSESERGGRIDWPGVCEDLAAWVDPEELEASLREFADGLLALPDLLRDAGVSDEVFSFPRIHVRDLPQKLDDWGLR